MPPKPVSTPRPKATEPKPTISLEHRPTVYPHLVNSLPQRWSYTGRLESPQQPHWYR